MPPCFSRNVVRSNPSHEGFSNFLMPHSQLASGSILNHQTHSYQSYVNHSWNKHQAAAFNVNSKTSASLVSFRFKPLIAVTDFLESLVLHIADMRCHEGLQASLKA